MPESDEQRICGYRDCGQEFTPKKPWQRFCRRKCRDREWDRRNPRVKALLQDMQRAGIQMRQPET